MDRLTGSDTENDEPSRVPKKEWQPRYCEHGHAIGLACEQCAEEGLNARKRPGNGLLDFKKVTGQKRSKKKPRTLCAHGRAAETCVKCEGTCVCTHGRRKTLCEECGGASICEHHIERTKCKVCGGVSVCVHGKMKAVCKLCDGVSLCTHGKQKCRCKVCGGKSFCEHGKRKSSCKLCGGSEFCFHGKRKSTCRECGGSAFCEHGPRTHHCPICKSKRRPKPIPTTLLNNTPPLVPFDFTKDRPPLLPVTPTRFTLDAITRSNRRTLDSASSSSSSHHLLLSPTEELWDGRDQGEDFLPILPIVCEEGAWTSFTLPCQPLLPSDSPLTLPRDSPYSDNIFKL